ncbi:amidase [uncultured Jatrophihabitans sp.]|uniref:amidase n=1 Tax=uncultured Jatrophihabitans sp. TaxID=1610747 RepID=UPI0035CA119D
MAISGGMTSPRIHSFGDDALGEHDAVALAQLVRDGQVSPVELADAAIARIRLVDPALNAIAADLFDAPRFASADVAARGALAGVPTLIKDNTDVEGVPTNHGSEAFSARPARRDGAYTAQYLSTGMTLLGKSRMPEFGFNATTEFRTGEPTRNPWRADHSVGASSGGSAALVAAGAVPIAHANDGGGSIRIPAACAGLVGLKCSRGRHVDGEQARRLPINMVSEGVLTRTVRDTAAFVAAAEDHWRNPKLPPIGLVHGPARRRLRVGVVVEPVTRAPVDEPTRAAVERVAALLEDAGHVVEPIEIAVDPRFPDDFVQYWALLADLATSTGKLTFDRSFDRRMTDGLTAGLRSHHRRRLGRTPGAIRRLRRVAGDWATMFARHELVLSPVLAHATPPLGFLAPGVPFDQLIDRLVQWVSYTPVDNIAGTPAISLPLGTSDGGLPVGVHLSAAHGDERTLLETAFALEEAAPFERIYA